MNWSAAAAAPTLPLSVDHGLFATVASTRLASADVATAGGAGDHRMSARVPGIVSLLGRGCAKVLLHLPGTRPTSAGVERSPSLAGMEDDIGNASSGELALGRFH